MSILLSIGGVGVVVLVAAFFSGSMLEPRRVQTPTGIRLEYASWQIALNVLVGSAVAAWVLALVGAVAYIVARPII